MQKCYKILGIPEDSDQEQIRAAYLVLVKKYHPDSGSNEANADKFLEVITRSSYKSHINFFQLFLLQIDTAFKVLTDKKAKERWGVEETPVKEQDIKVLYYGSLIVFLYVYFFLSTQHRNIDNI